jgi:hypothetical protein
VKRRDWGAYAPMPFVGATALLLVLLLLTPTLLSINSSGPGVLTQAELIVDRIPGVNLTHFYVRGYGLSTRYVGIWASVASNFSWTGSGSPNWSNLTWASGWNVSDSLSLAFASSENPIALNITAYYQSTGGSATYVGILAFVVAPGPDGTDLYGASMTSGITVPGVTPVDNSSLPLPILLVQGSSGGPPP